LAESRGSREKDFIVSLDGERYAFIHLTYSIEKDPRWPYTYLIGSSDDLQGFLDRWPEDLY
jgi:hypothetical protein